MVVFGIVPVYRYGTDLNYSPTVDVSSLKISPESSWESLRVFYGKLMQRDCRKDRALKNLSLSLSDYYA